MRLNEIEFLARHGVLRDVRTELDRDFRVLCLQSCYTSLLCSSGPARTVPCRSGRDASAIVSRSLMSPALPNSSRMSRRNASNWCSGSAACAISSTRLSRALTSGRITSLVSMASTIAYSCPNPHHSCSRSALAFPTAACACVRVMRRTPAPVENAPVVSWLPVLHPSVSCCCSAACYVGVGSVWLVFLPSPHASCMSDITRGTRDTSPVLCRGFATRRRCTALWFGVDVGAARSAAASKVIHPRPKGASQ